MHLWREYRFRSVFGVTHEQFLDEPTEAVEWMLAMHELMESKRHG